jgi:hypothetical protein
MEKFKKMSISIKILQTMLIKKVVVNMNRLTINFLMKLISISKGRWSHQEQGSYFKLLDSKQFKNKISGKLQSNPMGFNT